MCGKDRGTDMKLAGYTRQNPALNPVMCSKISDLGTLWQNAPQDGTERTFADALCEYAARVCYRSTSKMGTVPNFLHKIIENSHLDVIEHVTVAVKGKGPYTAPHRIQEFNRHCEFTVDMDNSWTLSANLRVWLEFFRAGKVIGAVPWLKAVAPKVFEEFDCDGGVPRINLGTVTGHNDEVMMPREVGQARVTLLGYMSPIVTPYNVHGTATFLIEGVSRSFTHQLVRHRLGSYSQESQRYTQYDSAMKSNFPPKIPSMIDFVGPKRNGHCLFSIEQEKFIVDLYVKGFNCEELGRKFDVHPTTIRGMVVTHGVELRDMQAAKTRHIKTDFFDEIDTPIKSQLLGLIYADGNIAQRDNVPDHGSITQHSDYKAWLKRLGKLWGGNVISGGREESSKVSIPGKKLAQTLVKHGAVPAKSKILEPPKLSGELARHFIRGYIEGDGHIGDPKNKRVICIVGTKLLLKWIQSEMRDAFGGKRPMDQKIHEGNGCFSLHICGKFQMQEVIEWLYEGFDFYYSHPAKLERATLISDKIKSEFYRQLSEWSDLMGVIYPSEFTPMSASLFVHAIEESAQAYANLRQIGVLKEDARSLLPNAARTRIVVSMNFGAWDHFFWLRAVDKAAQWEIREVAQVMLEMLHEVAPNVFKEHWVEYQKMLSKGVWNGN